MMRCRLKNASVFPLSVFPFAGEVFSDGAVVSAGAGHSAAGAFKYDFISRFC